MIEFDVDMDAVLDDADLVLLHDERGELPPMRFVPERTCTPIRRGTIISCGACGSELHEPFRFCGGCGAKVVGE